MCLVILKWALLIIIGIIFLFIPCQKDIIREKESNKIEEDKSFIDATLTILLGIIGGISSNLFLKDSLQCIELIALVVCSIIVFGIIIEKNRKI